MTHYSKYKDYFYRQKYKQFYFEYFILKYWIKNLSIPKNTRYKLNLKLQQLYNKTKHTKIKNRCMVSTKVRSTSRISNMTKASFKYNMTWGKLNGFRKSSW